MKIKKQSLLSPKTFNYLYSIGAAVVILGALFKLLHITGADLMLILGMGTEAIIFFISAFDEPTKEPNWENVYPGIYDKKVLSAEEKAELAERRKNNASVQQGGSTIIIGGGHTAAASSAAVNETGGTIIMGHPMSSASAPVAASQPVAAPAASGNMQLTPAQTDEVAEATSKYVAQLTAISASLEKMQAAMQGMGENTGYAQQLESLNRNIQGLNTIYEIQLKSVSSQLSTIEEVNRGLANIRSLYENGANDSFRIRQESDQLARNLQQLNEVYARMLQAMTVGKM